MGTTRQFKLKCEHYSFHYIQLRLILGAPSLHDPNTIPSLLMTFCLIEIQEKCQKYWPSTANEPWDVGFSLVVTLTELIPFAEYKVKIMKVENVSAHYTKHAACGLTIVNSSTSHSFSVNAKRSDQQPKNVRIQNLRINHTHYVACINLVTLQKMDPESCVPLIVTHYHFSVWPDHGVPVDKTSLIHFIQRVRRHHPFFNSPPLLVHCSAGVGRTGTFITLDSMIHMMKTESTLDILPFIRRMRNNRPLMVQTEVRDWVYNNVAVFLVLLRELNCCLLLFTGQI